MKYVHMVIGFCLAVYIGVTIPRFGIGEALATLTFVSTLAVSWFKFKKDLTGMFLAGMVLGVAIEWITEAYWDYHLSVYLWRDLSLFVVMGWGYSFTFFILLSNVVYKKITRQKTVPLSDRRLLLLDAALGPVWFLSNEFIAIRGFHLWEYSACANWTHLIPVVDFPWEGVISVMLFSIVFPSFVRSWERQFSVTGR